MDRFLPERTVRCIGVPVGSQRKSLGLCPFTQQSMYAPPFPSVQFNLLAPVQLASGGSLRRAGSSAARMSPAEWRRLAPIAARADSCIDLARLDEGFGPTRETAHSALLGSRLVSRLAVARASTESLAPPRCRPSLRGDRPSPSAPTPAERRFPHCLAPRGEGDWQSDDCRLAGRATLPIPLSRNRCRRAKREALACAAARVTRAGGQTRPDRTTEPSLSIERCASGCAPAPLRWTVPEILRAPGNFHHIVTDCPAR